jgi:tRNA-dihydrouridine synthase B
LKALEQSGADGVMIGRAAQGRPWIFREVRAALAGSAVEPPVLAEVRAIMLSHLEALYSFYGESQGVRVARKHLGWYCRLHQEVGHLPAGLLKTEIASEQLSLTDDFLTGCIGRRQAGQPGDDGEIQGADLAPFKAFPFHKRACARYSAA